MPTNIEIKQKYCPHCRKTRDTKYFYKSNNKEKFPDGYLTECKDCRTRKVDNWVPSTYLDILEECDVPYIPDKWNDLLRRYCKDPSQVTGQTVIGRYLSAVKIKPWNEYRWADTEYLQSIADEKAKQAMIASGYTAAEIDKELRTRLTEAPQKPDIDYSTSGTGDMEGDYFNLLSGTQDSTIENDLTEEEKIALRLKWGKTYRPEEWVQLEQFYQEMLLSYDITAAGDLNSLKMACKASLKANQLLDIGDVDGAQKMAKVYDGLMKAGKWTAAQNKTEDNEIVDSIGELVALCEKDGFIPRYYIDEPKDKVDRVIQDMQVYTRNLVVEELGLGNMIENALKAIKDEQDAIEAAGEYAEAHGTDSEDSLFDYEKPPVTEADYQEFAEFEEDWEEEAALILEALSENED